MQRTSPRLTVVEHPLIQHKLTCLRDRTTPMKVVRELVEELSSLMTVEATRDLSLDPVTVRTPLEEMEGGRLAGGRLVVVPILRAGMGMLSGVLRLLPTARVGHVGLYRNEETLEPVEYYVKIPAGPEDREFIVIDPMLATGGSAMAAVKLLKDRGATQIRVVCLVAAPEGVADFHRAHPQVPLFAAAVDRQLSEKGYILPGLGDAGDRIFGTR
jgi:uracil phosphoribosyltransferase